MKRTLLTIGIVLSLIAPAIAQAPNHQALITAQDSAVYVTANLHVDSVDGIKDAYDEPICSGSILRAVGAYEDILTARHCTVDEQGMFGTVKVTPAHVHFWDGDVGVVQSISRDPHADIAVLHVHSMRRHPHTIRFADSMHMGEPVFMVGLPNGIYWNLSTALIMSAVEISPQPPDFVNLVQLECASCYGGDSGAAVYDDAGHVVGLLDAKSPNTALMIATSRIRASLPRMK